MKTYENINQHEPGFQYLADTDIVNTTVEQQQQDEDGEDHNEGGESNECQLQLLCAGTLLDYMCQREGSNIVTIVQPPE